MTVVGFDLGRREVIELAVDRLAASLGGSYGKRARLATADSVRLAFSSRVPSRLAPRRVDCEIDTGRLPITVESLLSSRDKEVANG
jgi:hypothetical protein